MDEYVKKETTVKTIRLENSLIEKIAKDAEKGERNFSQQVTYIIKKYYEIQEATK